MANSGSRDINITGPSNIGSVGDNNTVTVGRQQQSVGITDFAQLADQLGQLNAIMAGAVRSDGERASLAAVRDAQDAARRNDEAGVRRYLAAVGRWALAFAEHLSLAAVTTAIKTGTGG